MDRFTPLVGIVTAEADDDRMLPTLSGPDSAFPVAFDEQDGDNILYFRATTLDLQRLPDQGKSYDVVHLDEHKVDVAITDSRVVLACEKYDKGGGWSGFGLAGMTIAAGANVVSRARAAKRRQGSVLVGQVRYSWLAYAGGRTGSWWSKDQLALAAYVSKEEGAGGQLILLHAPEGAGSCHELAAEIARRAATWRLTYDRFASSSARAGFEQLKNAAPKRANKGAKKYATHDLAMSWPVQEFTAFSMNKDLEAAWAARHVPDAEVD